MSEEKRPVTILLKPHHFIQMRRWRIFAFLIDIIPFIVLLVLYFFILKNIVETIPNFKSDPPESAGDAIFASFLIVILLTLAF
jgi:hypothetical protein